MALLSSVRETNRLGGSFYCLFIHSFGTKGSAAAEGAAQWSQAASQDSAGGAVCVCGRGRGAVKPKWPELCRRRHQDTDWTQGQRCQVLVVGGQIYWNSWPIVMYSGEEQLNTTGSDGQMMKCVHTDREQPLMFYFKCGKVSSVCFQITLK